MTIDKTVRQEYNRDRQESFGRRSICLLRRAGRSKYQKKVVILMKRIACTYENGQIFGHFGHTEYFKIYDIENGAVAGSVILSTNGSGHGALASFLAANRVDTLICGGIGGGAQTALAQVGIRLYGGVSGSADEAVKALLEGRLGYDPDVHCDHHGEHHHGSDCGGASCQPSSCGSCPESRK